VLEFSMLGNGNWKRTRVTRIAYRGVSIHGRAYVGFYTELGTEGAQISGSITEGDESTARYYRLSPEEGHPALVSGPLDGVSEPRRPWGPYPHILSPTPRVPGAPSRGPAEMQKA